MAIVKWLLRKRDCPDRFGVTFTDGDTCPCIPIALCAGGRCPYAGGMVFGSGDEPLVIRGNGETENHIGMSGEETGVE